MSADLAAFLLARIAEDEEAARRLPEMRWYVDDDGCLESPIDTGPDGEDNLPNHHNSWWLVLDPARVLAECEARRRIVERAQFVDDHGPAVDHTRALDMTIGASAALRDVLRFLAEPYRSHPDYDPSWRP